MTMLNKVALSYLKYCSVIETARDELAKNMMEILELSGRPMIKTEVDDGLIYVRIDKPPYYLYFGTHEEKIEIGIAREKTFLLEEIEFLKSKVKNLEGEEGDSSQYVWRKYPIGNFKKGVEEFIEVFKLLRKT